MVLTLVLLAPAWNIPGLFRAYFLGFGVALILATTFAFWQKRIARAGRTWLFPAVVVTVTGLMLVVQLRAAHARNALWLAAGDWSRQVMAATSALVPAPADGTTFYYWDLPLTHQGIVVYNWGLREAVQINYQNAS